MLDLLIHLNDSIIVLFERMNQSSRQKLKSLSESISNQILIYKCRKQKKSALACTVIYFTQDGILVFLLFLDWTDKTKSFW